MSAHPRTRDLEGWLSEPSGRGPLPRHPEALFLGLLPRAVPDLTTAQIDALSESLMTLKAMHEKFSSRPRIASQIRTLELGIALNEAALAFWRSVLDDPASSSDAIGRVGTGEDRVRRKSE